MVSDKKVKELENSTVELSLTVGADAVKSSYDKVLKKYLKSAHIKGFRKGKVPAKVLETKYGEALKDESMMNIMDEALKTAIDEIDEKHRPLPYSSPTLLNEENTSLDLESDFTFSVSYEVYPSVTISKFSDYTVEVPEVTVTEDDIVPELTALQDQNALVAETDTPVQEKSIVTVTFWEVDEEGNEVPDTRRDEFTFTLGAGYNRYQIDEDIIGMSKGEIKVIEKTYPEEFHASDLAGKSVKLHVEIDAVKKRDIPELDDEFAQDISESYNTLDDLKKDIRSRLENDVETRMKDLKLSRIIKHIIEDHPFTLPSSMIDAQVEQSWQNYIRQYQIPEEQMLKILEAQGLSKERFTENWRASAESTLKHSIILQEFIKSQDIEVTDEQLEEAFSKEMEDAPEDLSPEVKDYYREMLKDRLKQQQAAELLIGKNTFTSGASMGLRDFLEGYAEAEDSAEAEEEEKQ